MQSPGNRGYAAKSGLAATYVTLLSKLASVAPKPSNAWGLRKTPDLTAEQRAIMSDRMRTIAPSMVPTHHDLIAYEPVMVD